jgi:methionine aminopeptidase
MIKILMNDDNIDEYKEAVELVGDCLEDWDFIIVPDMKISEDNYRIERIADKLEVSGNKYYKTKDGKDFIVVYH